MSTSLLLRLHIIPRCISRPERLPPTLSFRNLLHIGCQNARDVPVIGDSFSKANF